ncbi:MAG: hypothetical protein H0U75_04480 [Legionella sp.]|nr:hypothetical protein [Legionella sp.]
MNEFIDIFWLTIKLVVHCTSIYEVARKVILTAIGKPKRTHAIQNRIFIDYRPEVDNQKSRVGDWEIVLSPTT